MDISSQEFEQMYSIGKVIGEGGFGSVHLAISKKDGNEYAVKRVQLPMDDVHRTIILREKETMQKLSHENIVKCFHFSVVKGMYHGTCKIYMIVHKYNIYIYIIIIIWI